MEPEIIEEGENYKIIIPKKLATKESIRIFLSNLLKSKESATEEDRLGKLIETLNKKWPNEEKFVPKSISDLKVLITDDQTSVRKIMKKSLKDLLFQTSNIEEAGDGITAIEKIIRKKFDIIFSDWNMPGVNGLELLKILKEVPGLKHMFFIMVTTRGNQKCVMEAIESGIDGYIIKPFTTAQVEKILKKTIPA